MKTVTFTASEIRTLFTYLECNPCLASCRMGYKTDMCFAHNKDGVARCALQRDWDSIVSKLEEPAERKKKL